MCYFICLLCLAVFALLLGCSILGVWYWMGDKSCFTNRYHLKLYCYRLINCFFFFSFIFLRNILHNSSLALWQPDLQATSGCCLGKRFSMLLIPCTTLWPVPSCPISLASNRFHFSKFPNILLNRFLRVNVFHLKFWCLILKHLALIASYYRLLWLELCKTEELLYLIQYRFL